MGSTAIGWTLPVSTSTGTGYATGTDYGGVA